MYDYKESWKQQIANVLNSALRQAGMEETVRPADVVAEIPPNPEMGDLGFPLYGFAKIFRKAPPVIAQLVSAELPEASAAGPYLNVRLNRGEAAAGILKDLFSSAQSSGESEAASDSTLGRPATLCSKKIMVEFSSPNTNKPLHLGHLRNDVLGESLSRILKACGAEVRKVCIINDRGIHICKSMLAYQEQGQGQTPESSGIKSDRFVGDWYVSFSKSLKAEAAALEKEQGLDEDEAEARAPLMFRAKDLLRKWEAGDRETVELWKTMNNWAVSGMKQTYLRTGVSFDTYYYESETWRLGKEEVLKGLERGIFHRENDGAVAVDLTAEKLDKKILLRSDGTSIYITQDFGTAINRHKDWPFDRLIYVVGSEQQYHFKVLFTLLDKLGYPWAKNLHHLSYGMVNLPEGKMKSREGTVVDADDLLDSLRAMALTEIRDKDREEAVGDGEAAAESIALGALHYFLLQITPSKDMLFDPKESLSFNGNTGPYLQYMGARISSLLAKANDTDKENPPRFELLETDAEWELVRNLGDYNDTIAAAAATMDPSVLTTYLYNLAKAFSRFYHDCPILSAPSGELVQARLALCKAVLLVLQDALHLTCIPFLKAM